MDSLADNYVADANSPGGDACIRAGCTNSLATNFDPDATLDNVRAAPLPTTQSREARDQTTAST